MFGIDHFLYCQNAIAYARYSVKKSEPYKQTGIHFGIHFAQHCYKEAAATTKGIIVMPLLTDHINQATSEKEVDQKSTSLIFTANMLFSLLSLNVFLKWFLFRLF